MLSSQLQQVLYIYLAFMVAIYSTADLKNPHVQKKLQQKLKQQQHALQKSYKQKTCDISEWRPKIKQDVFIISNQNTLTSINSIAPWLDNCTEKSEDLIKIEWRFLFFEELHCIRVEFDFGDTLEKFRN